MADIIQRINCVESPAGFILSWDVAEGVEIVRTTVYGLNGEREFVLDSPIVATGRFILSPNNYHLITAFKLQVVTDTGDVETSKNISPQRMTKQERLLLNEMRLRAQVYMRSTPIGSYSTTVLLRRMDGAGCDRCGSGICSGNGGLDAVSDYCPVCLGTGKLDPYYVYPEKILLHGISPRDDSDVMENPAVQRSHVTRSFQSVFDLNLRAGDVLVSGTEVYRVLDQKIPASVGNVPVFYNLATIKYAPEDPRYKTFMQLAHGGCEYA